MYRVQEQLLEVEVEMVKNTFNKMKEREHVILDMSEKTGNTLLSQRQYACRYRTSNSSSLILTLDPVVDFWYGQFMRSLYTVNMYYCGGRFYIGFL